jgi:AsmA protein
MSRSRRLIILAAIGFVGLLVLVTALLFFLVGAKVDKARIEATASQALALDVSIGGPLRIGFFPGLLVTIEDVHIRSQGVDIASAQQARLEVDLLPLLKNEVRIEKIALKQPRISIERDREGRFNFERPEAAGRTLPALHWPNVSLSDATLVYLDKRFGERFEAEDCRLDAHDLRLVEGTSTNLMQALSFTAELSCAKVRGDGFTVSDLKLSADAKKGVFDLKPVTTQVFGTQGSGSVQADFSKAVPAYHVHYVLPQFPVEDFFKTMTRQKVASGRMDFTATLSMQGTTEKQMRQTLTGQISLRGRNLTLSGADLDREFARFETSQRFNLVDVGAFFFVGPLGLVVTKGLNFANVLQESSGSSEIRTLVSDWKVERGVAQAQDVAMATKQNRVALQGGLDLVGNRFDDVTVALIDAKGCAKVRQEIRGTFQNPVVERPNVLASLAGPALRLLKKGSEWLGGGHCEVFYAGSVAAPK